MILREEAARAWILNDPCADFSWLDYGITIPFPAGRPGRILDFLNIGSGSPALIDCPRAIKLLDALDGKASGPCRSDIERVHQKNYVDALFGKNGEAGVVKSILEIYELIDENGRPRRYDESIAKKPVISLFNVITLDRLYGTYIAARLALQNRIGFCYYLAGGNHHARYGSGAGFCVLNDMIYAARKLQAGNRADIVWLIDVDAHKGCGSAEIASFLRCGIFTLSLHMAHGWPLDEKTLSEAKAGFAPLINSDVEIPVERGDENSYCSMLEAGLLKLENMTGTCDIAFVVDGSDPYEKDELESSALLNLTLEQCVERDMLIFNFLQKRGIKSAWVLGGGYGNYAWEPHAHFLSRLISRGTFASSNLKAL